MARLRAEADTLGFCLGFGLIVAGVALIYAPAAFMVAGLMLCGAAISATRAK